MSDLKQDVRLLLHLNEVLFPSNDARKFVYSKRFLEVVAAGVFFDEYALDSDERFYINEIANYFEKLGMLWRRGVVDKEKILEWQGVGLYWGRVGQMLVQSRTVFGIDDLWEEFEALAEASNAS
ncbi:MAG: hypothetical protein AAED33_13995 [Paracoccaceae bacterium]|jgi:hypothetical protein